jgi:hypothetical protein
MNWRLSFRLHLYTFSKSKLKKNVQDLNSLFQDVLEASLWTKTGCHDIAEILLKVHGVKHNKSNKIQS